MSFFTANLIHTITVREPTTARDANGDFVGVASKRSIRARVEARVDRVRTPDGTEATTAHRIYLDEGISQNAALWVPHLGDDVTNDNDARKILTITAAERLRGGGTLWTVYL